MVEQLIQAGAKVDVHDKSRETPLHDAVGGNHLQVVEKLIEGGADVNIQGPNDATPLHSAAREGNTVKRVKKEIISKNKSLANPTFISLPKTVL